MFDSRLDALSLLAASLLLTSLGGVPAAHAFDSDVTVNDVRDLPDPSPNVGPCNSTADTCTLRAAIMRANSRIGQHIIRLPAGTFTLTRAGRDEDEANAGDLDLRRDITIAGAGAGATIVDAAGIDRVFDGSGRRDIVLRDLTIRGGDAQSAGSGARGGGGVRAGGFGSGNGSLTLSRVRVANNFARSVGGGVQVVVIRSLHIERSAIVDNGLVGDANLFGSAVDQQGGKLTILDTTIAGNTSNTASTMTIDLFGVDATIRRSTIVGEGVKPLFVNLGGGLSTVDLGATILEGAGTACSRIGGNGQEKLVVFDSGNNIESGDTCVLLPQKGNLVNTGARLGAATVAGGTTFLPPLAGSPAIDHIPAAACGASKDQRGLPRPRAGVKDGDASCDVGAIEVQGSRGEPGVVVSGGADEPLVVDYSWTVPEPDTWRDLATLDLRIRSGSRVVFWVRWSEQDDRFVELAPNGDVFAESGSAYAPGFVLDPELSSSSSAGPESPEVTLHLTLLPERVLRAGALTIEVAAEDDAGETQAFSAYEPFGATSPRVPRRLAILR